jgi:hypothetical protein
VSVVDEPSKNKKVCHVQFTADGLFKLILSKPKVTSNGNYNAFLYNYRYSIQSTELIYVFQVEIKGLTHSGRYLRGA